MSANPGGGDYVPETDARGMDNQGTELDRLRAEVARLRAALAAQLLAYGSGPERDAELQRLTDHSAALEGPSGATEPAPGTPGRSGASGGRREAHGDEVERLRRGLYPLATLTPRQASAMAEDIGASADSLFIDWINRGKEVEQWRARALAAEDDAALLSEKLAARAALRHQLDPTRGSEDGWDSGGFGSHVREAVAHTKNEQELLIWGQQWRDAARAAEAEVARLRDRLESLENDAYEAREWDES
jgi:hypothetical protein